MNLWFLVQMTILVLLSLATIKFINKRKSIRKYETLCARHAHELLIKDQFKKDYSYILDGYKCNVCRRYKI